MLHYLVFVIFNIGYVNPMNLCLKKNIECKTDTLTILMHQMRISTTQVSSRIWICWFLRCWYFTRQEFLLLFITLKGNSTMGSRDAGGTCNLLMLIFYSPKFLLLLITLKRYFTMDSRDSGSTCHLLMLIFYSPKFLLLLITLKRNSTMGSRDFDSIGNLLMLIFYSPRFSAIIHPSERKFFLGFKGL
jgi:hypothetical protein